MIEPASSKVPQPAAGEALPPRSGPLQSSRSARLWLLAALALLLLQVLPFLDRRWVTDESWYSGPGYSIAQGHGVRDPAIGPNDLENHFDARPPGTALVIALFFKVFGVGPIQARAGSVLAALAIVLLTWRLARGSLNPWQAGLAALLVATDTLVVTTARTARPEALTTMAVLLALLAIRAYGRQGTSVSLFLSGLALAAATTFHITVLGFIFSLGLLACLIERERGGVGLRAPLVYLGGYLAGLIPFAAWILSAPLGPRAFKAEYIARSLNQSLPTKFLLELGRYKDMFGIGFLHAPGLELLPVRLPVPLAFAVASFLLWRFRRRWFYLELLLLIPTLLWFVDTANRTSRYLVLVSPLVALTIAAAISVLPKPGSLRRPMIAGAAALVALQLLGNLYLLASARRADYPSVTARLRNAVPSGEPVYASMTFWLAFYDHTFVSYERTTIDQAARDFHVRYFIVGDRMMMNPQNLTGQSIDADFYKELNVAAAALPPRSDLVASISDPYYGDLKVYRLRETAP